MDDGEGFDGQGEETARRLIASWLSETTQDELTGASSRALGTGLPAPRAEAREVIETARRLAVQGLAGAPLPIPPVELLLIAEALVVDEHPSAAGWTEAERGQVAKWIAVLVDRFGEDGVQRLMAALANRR